jgi:hypothetical protein
VAAYGWRLIPFYFDGSEQQHRHEPYRLDDDISRSANLAVQQPECVKAMDRMIDGFRAGTKAVKPKRNPNS